MNKNEQTISWDELKKQLELDKQEDKKIYEAHIKGCNTEDVELSSSTAFDNAEDDRFFDLVKNINDEISEERKAQTQKANSMTLEELTEMAINETKEVNKVAKAINQPTVMLKNNRGEE
jgi:hypothetical protein